MLESIQKSLREMVERCEKATPGPWFNGQYQDGELLPDGSGYAGDWYESDEIYVPGRDDDNGFIGKIWGDDDRKLVIAARTDLPRVLKALEVAVDRLAWIDRTSEFPINNGSEGLKEIASILSGEKK